MLYDELTQERKRRGEVFKSARESQNIGLNELSRATGLARQTIRNMEAGRSAWNIDTEILLMRALKISQMGGSIEISQLAGRITSLKIIGVNLNNAGSAV